MSKRDKTLANIELLRVVFEYVGGAHFLFVGGTSKEWCTHYSNVYPALKTNLSSVVSSAERVKWAVRHGLELTVKVFKVAAMHGDVDVCKALYAKGCPWDEWVCSRTLFNEQHGLSILQWLRSEDLPAKKRCPWYGSTCGYALYRGNIETVQWLLSDEGNAPLTSHNLNCALKGGHIPVVEYLLHHPRTRALLEENGNGMWRKGSYYAARMGHLGVLQLLHANGRHLCLWNADVCKFAVMGAKSLATLKWLRSEEVQCAWDERSCPQVLRDRGLLPTESIDAETFEETKQWVHANGKPCQCQD